MISQVDDQYEKYAGTLVEAKQNQYYEEIKTGKTSNLVGGDSVFAKVYGSGTEINPDGYPITFVDSSVKITNRNKEDVTNNYAIVLKPEKLYLTKQEYELTISSPNQEFTYDGKTHTLPTTITGKDITQVDGSMQIEMGGKKYKIVGYQPASGKNSAQYDTTAAGNIKVVEVDNENKEAPYAFTIKVEKKGTLTINPIQITLTSDGDSKIYDGKPLTKPGVTQTGKFVEGEELDIKATGSVTNVSEGKKKNTISVTTNLDETIFTQNYNITKNEGDLYILPKDISMADTDKTGITINDHLIQNMGMEKINVFQK